MIGPTIGEELSSYDRLWNSAFAWQQLVFDMKLQARSRAIEAAAAAAAAQTNEECAAQVKQDRLPRDYKSIKEFREAFFSRPEEVEAWDQSRRRINEQAVARFAAAFNQGKHPMSQKNESNAYLAKLGADESGRIRTSDAQKSAPASQVQNLLNEGGALLNELNEEIYRTCRQFEPVLLPSQPQPEKAGSQPPHEIRSELADTLAARNETLRISIAELRAINNRSTVAP